MCIRDRYNGGRMCGISTSSSYPFIFLFTGDMHAADAYDYTDGWARNMFFYSGAGRIGDQHTGGSNGRVINHVKTGRRIFLFCKVTSGIVKYITELRLDSYSWKDRHDSEKRMRKAILFCLAPLDPSAIPIELQSRISYIDRCSRPQQNSTILDVIDRDDYKARLKSIVQAHQEDQEVWDLINPPIQYHQITRKRKISCARIRGQPAPKKLKIMSAYQKAKRSNIFCVFRTDASAPPPRPTPFPTTVTIPDAVFQRYNLFAISNQK
eukprot:TRINITY_DN1930_c0_g1_i1.p1 TRINITY_DN1930_c0_g1~~TRINITY_DN1930_c0_g1_i1.p1  ORF type:complete len:266 (+),score=30.06 TRINITY_DN1930_c0_g1_i1:41-838(+)